MTNDDKELSDFLAGKSQHAIELFDHLLMEYQRMGNVRVHAKKSMISFAARTGFAYVIQLGKILSMWFSHLSRLMKITSASAK
jgi:hypothetical protein